MVIRSTPVIPKVLSKIAPEKPSRAAALVCNKMKILTKSIGFSKMMMSDGISIG